VDDGLIAVLYVLLLPLLPLAAFVYNFLIYPAKYKSWEASYMCQRCGGRVPLQAND
jgi:hypothetical protein